ncbi:alpha/beta hydrolase family protein [Saccharicrinis aurantiacus]|uniref:alpha/beta hydrolase family protein n=1 Tax=Saccharicrinis aurantiacus TaxID=1849719 RepID=UPI00248F8349|nr:alpha/beta fold hydrolase [Saccharicrinis aurantiacus]
MKNLFTLITILSLCTALNAQEIVGSWHGTLKIQGVDLPLVFNISQTDAAYAATLDSPAQGAMGIPVSTITYTDSELNIKVQNLGIHYNAHLNAEGIFEGTFKQGTFSLPLELTQKSTETKAVLRPQEPSKPYTYYSEDITFRNSKDNIQLAGTLTMPAKTGHFPAVVLISGSGPQNRDEALFGHKPFLVLSDYLTKNGIAVLRFDDRGTAESEGNFVGSSTYDFAKDVESAIEYLKSRPEINKDKLGLIGHSEGGIIASIIAAQNNDVNYAVLMAGTALRGDQLLLLQAEKISAQMGMDTTVIKQNQEMASGAHQIILNEELSNHKLKDSLMNYYTLKYDAVLTPQQKMGMVNQLTSTWMVEFIRLDPMDYLSQIRCPLLAINGSKDLQVPAEENLSLIEKAATQSGNTKMIVKELDGLNHLFQECETGAIAEYGIIEQTISPIALEEMLAWIKLQVN